MPSVLLISVGSRGDSEPFASLAASLTTEPHSCQFDRVLTFLQSDLPQLCPPSVPPTDRHVLPFGQNDFYRYAANPSGVKDGDSPRTRFVAVVLDIIAELVLPCGPAVLDAASDANIDVIVSSSLAQPLALAVAEKLGIRSVVVHLQPTVPTSLFPHHSNAESCAAALKYAVDTLASGESLPATAGGGEDWREEYWTLELAKYSFLKDRLDKFCARINVPSPTFEDMRPMLSGHHPNVHVANCFPPDLVPRCLDAGPHVWEVGPLADSYIPADFVPDNTVMDFLSGDDPRPVCIGYGSMPLAGNVKSMSRRVLSAVRQSNAERAIIVGGASDIGPHHLAPVVCDDRANSVGGVDDSKEGEDNKDDAFLFEWAERNVLCVRNAGGIPYGWLLPQCSAILCHGGAGVISSALAAGTPPIVSPFMGDQFMWARALDLIGVGVFAGPNNRCHS